MESLVGWLVGWSLDGGWLDGESVGDLVGPFVGQLDSVADYKTNMNYLWLLINLITKNSLFSFLIR